MQKTKQKSEIPYYTCHMSHVTCHLSHGMCLMSHVTCRMSHVTHDMSHVTCHMAPNFICPEQLYKSNYWPVCLLILVDLVCFLVVMG